MTANIDYEVPTWNQIYDMLLSQAQKIQSQNYKPDVIVGVARGGTIPARILTDLLETSKIGAVQIEFYIGIAETMLEPSLKQAFNTQLMDKKILLVDDIADSGRSLKLAITYLQEQSVREIKTATLYLKPQSITTPDFYETQTISWVVFPWEAKETLRKIIQKHQSKRALNQEVSKLVKAGLPKQLVEKLLKDMQ